MSSVPVDFLHKIEARFDIHVLDEIEIFLGHLIEFEEMYEKFVYLNKTFQLCKITRLSTCMPIWRIVPFVNKQANSIDVMVLYLSYIYKHFSANI